MIRKRIGLIIGFGILLVSSIQLMGINTVNSNTQHYELIANCSSQSCNQAQQGAGILNNGSNLSLKEIIGSVASVLAWIIGVVSVFVVIFAGFRYVTSGGDPNAVSGSRSMIIYAIVGIFIAALAQVILHFVVKKFFLN